MTANSVSNNISGVVYYDRISNLSSKKSYTKSFAEVQNPNDVYKLTSPEAKKVLELIRESQPLQQRMRPPYFRDYYEYNNNLAMSEAKRLVEIAKKDGFDLDVNMLYEDVRKWNGIEDEPPAAEWVDEKGFTVGVSAKWLSDEEKAMLEQMHDYAITNGLPLKQVNELAALLGMDKMVKRSSSSETILGKEYLHDLIGDISNKNGSYHTTFQRSIIEMFLDNFDKFKTNAEAALAKRAGDKHSS